MLNSLIRLLALLYESNLAWILGGLAIFFGGAIFVMHKQTGESNVKELLISMVMGDRGVRAHEKEFWDRNPNLEFVQRYSQSSMTEVRVRDAASRTAVIDRYILSDVRIQTSPCEGAGMFTAAELYPGAADLVCFTLNKPNDADGDYPYRFAASFTAPAKATTAGEFYDKFLRARGMAVTVITDNDSLQVLEGHRPGTGTVVRVAIRSYGGTTHVFLAASDAFAAQQAVANPVPR